ncbi:MAG TPA: SpoIIE family protein phosphatase [Tepidisphaeraceae bacterium]|jgi:sigma-B regulation protein RsbU (phosphoserine phosphatase)
MLKSALPKPLDTFGGDSLACILPQTAMTVETRIEQLQEHISQLTFDLNVLRRRDEQINGVITRLDEEQRLAARLQQDFLPKRLPQVGPIHFSTLYRPASYVSGDLYDVTQLDEHHIGFYVADAVGHGMPAALLTMFMKNALVTKEISANGYRLLHPAETLSKLNVSLCQQNLSNATFATAVYGTIDTRSLQMSLCRGGHPSPVLIRNAALHDLGVDGALLGIFPDEVFTETVIQLQAGDRVVVYTDGIEVAFSEDDRPDNDRWRGEILSRADQHSEIMLQNFAARVDSHNGSLLPKDDLTIVAFDVR